MKLKIFPGKYAFVVGLLLVIILALAWVLRNPNVASAIVGASKAEQVTRNVQAIDITLDDDLVAKVEAILQPVTTTDPGKTLKDQPKERL